MIFITGATGLVGSRLINRILQSTSDEVYALKRRSSDLGLLKRVLQREFPDFEAAYSRIRWIEGDLNDFCLLNEHIQPGAEVYHLAAAVSFNPKHRAEVLRTNIEGTALLVDVCLDVGIRKMVYASSIAALGRNEATGIVTESDYRTKATGTSVYSTSKYEAELEIWRGIACGLQAAIVNPAVIIGSGNWSHGSSELITTVYKGLKFYTKGINGYVDADDVARAMISLMESNISGERFILSSENLSYEELFKSIAKHLGVKGPQFYASPWMGAIAWRVLAVISSFTGSTPLITRDTARNARSVYKYSSEKIQNALGFQFKTIDEAIKEACIDFINQK